MKVGKRLFIAVIPAILGLGLVAGLAYWGQYEHRIPAIVLAIAIVAAVGTLVLAWQNTRYVAERVARLAAHGASRAEPTLDELDEIESEVGRLEAAAADATAQGVQRERDAERQIGEYRRLLIDTASDISRQLDDVRLPLHILLENRFGELNENQEEMLVAARTSADSADETARRLRQLAEMENGDASVPVMRERAEDLFRAMLAGVSADAARAGVRLTTSFAPPLPTIRVDRARAQEGLALLIHALIHGAPEHSDVRVSIEANEQHVALHVSRPIQTRGIAVRLGLALIAAQGARVESTDLDTTIVFPVAPADRRVPLVSVV